jgi:hypothetical protein
MLSFPFCLSVILTEAVKPVLLPLAPESEPRSFMKKLIIIRHGQEEQVYALFSFLKEGLNDQFLLAIYGH